MRSLRDWHWHWYDPLLGLLTVSLTYLYFWWNSILVPFDVLLKNDPFVGDFENVNYLVPTLIMMLGCWSWVIRIGAWLNYEIE